MIVKMKIMPISSFSFFSQPDHGGQRSHHARWWNGLTTAWASVASRFQRSGHQAEAVLDQVLPMMPNHHAERRAADSQSQDALLRELKRVSRRVSPLVKRHILPAMPGVPKSLSVGWVQFPETQGRGYTLGVFTDRNHCSPVAFADRQGRVFAGGEVNPDTQQYEPAFIFAKEGEVMVPESRLRGEGSLSDAHGDAMALVHAVQGSIAGRDDTGSLMWLASWLKNRNRYTLEQMRPDLPVALRTDLEYRDAVAVAFFATYLLPRLNGFVVGFGSGNIFRRLRHEAPMGAIRRSVRDTMRARAHGMRASGLEDHFADLMGEAGALDPVEGLEAVHGAEPLHLYVSPYSESYYFTWESGLPFSAALTSLNIEGNLNRFATVSSWLERNARIGVYPTEDTVTRAEAAQLDWALLTNPALTALQLEEEPGQGFDPVNDDGSGAVVALVQAAREAAAETAEEYPDPVEVAQHSEHLPQHHDANGSEWVYRQTLSLLMRRLRLPYRFDVDFRSNLQQGDVALGFTSAGTAMMPRSRYDEHRHGWVKLSDTERAALSTDYNLRVGLLMTVLAFGADDHVQRVALRIDSIGLEEAISEQDSAISSALDDMLNAFDRMRTGKGVGKPAGGKADPKDGDIHGNPSKAMGAEAMEGMRESAAQAVSDEHADAAAHHADDDAGTDDDDRGGSEAASADAVDIDQTFQDLMKDVDLDTMAFSMDNDRNDDATDADSVADGHKTDGMNINAADPLAALRKDPTIRNLVTVVFDRETFLRQIKRLGLSQPVRIYQDASAVMKLDEDGGLCPVEAGFNLRDARFSPAGSQEEPELAEIRFTRPVAHVLGTQDTLGLSIQRADVLQRVMDDARRLSSDPLLNSVDKAQRAMRMIGRVADPELDRLAPKITSALIDGTDIPNAEFRLSDELNDVRMKARDLLFGGQPDKAVETEEAAVAELDELYANADGVPRYFNSYAERVVYNRLFATPGERTVLIPDNLFYAHMELADVRSQLEGPAAAMPHYSAMVSYAPAYPLAHMKMAIQMAHTQDWDSARAACLNALRVSLDRDDAAFAYYRLAYASWMRDEFDVAAAAYLMSDHISSGAMGSLETELNELVSRARSQCIPVPTTLEDAQRVLQEYDLPVWPRVEVASIMRQGARVCVDQALFMPARTLSMAAARMNDGGEGGLDAIQIQFLRSLSV